MDLSQAVSSVVTVLTSLITFITGNWLLIFLAFAPFVLGLVIALIRSFRG